MLKQELESFAINSEMKKNLEIFTAEKKEKVQLQTEPCKKNLENFNARQDEKVQTDKLVEKLQNCDNAFENKLPNLKNTDKDVWLGMRTYHARHASRNSANLQREKAPPPTLYESAPAFPVPAAPSVPAVHSSSCMTQPIAATQAGVDPCSTVVQCGMPRVRDSAAKEAEPANALSKIELEKNVMNVAALKTVGEFNLNLQYEPVMNIQLLINQQIEDPFVQELSLIHI